ncbi:MAG: alpha-glucosidase [Gaiellaceae bacterium]|nr:alpha-glucosidase [Gaiellaceae bacterium]
MTGGEWWRHGVLYQVYPRSFADSNGDGIGDLAGLTSRLEYLEWLGVDGIWLNPTMPSPNADWGYDVADYCDVHPDLGTLADLDELVAAAEARGIRILLDLVPNHTSDRHRWFADSRGARESPRRDWYFWRDPKPDGSPPNNWLSVFGAGGPAWKLDPATEQMYLHHFLPEQPDLNWWNEEVRAAFDGVQRFWFDRGVAGFRIDVVSELVKQRGLPDEDGEPEQFGKHSDIPETHHVLKRWRTLADSYDPPRLLLGETWAMDAPTLSSVHGEHDDELNLAFNFPFMLAPLDPEIMVPVVEATEAVFSADEWPVWTGSNHDFPRFPTRWCEGDERKVRCALLLLLTLRGTPVLYYGDELGLPQVDVSGADVRDIAGRDGARTPMHWSPEDGAGFTEPGVKPWLPFGDFAGRNVADQQGDSGSTLAFVRDLIALRRESEDLRGGAYATLVATESSWAWRRGRGTIVALNLSDSAETVEGVQGAISIATSRERDGERVGGRLRLEPWSGAVVS